MNFRADQIAGGAFIALGILVFIIGWDLPFGSLTTPGAGMLPKVLATLMIAFAAIIIITSDGSETLSEMPWGDWKHAAAVLVVASLATLVYSTLGFLLTMPLLLFTLLAGVERRNLIAAAIFSVALTLFCYWLFAILLKSPLERGVIWN